MTVFGRAEAGREVSDAVLSRGRARKIYHCSTSTQAPFISTECLRICLLSAQAGQRRRLAQRMLVADVPHPPSNN